MIIVIWSYLNQELFSVNEPFIGYFLYTFPVSVCSAQSLVSFHSQLKTCFFKTACPPYGLSYELTYMRSCIHYSVALRETVSTTDHGFCSVSKIQPL